jgi:hypothetical protein
MSHALELRPPKGTSPLQWRLAQEIVAGAISWADAMRKAGYKPSTAYSDARDIRERPGVQRAIAAIERHQMDSARGLNGAAERGLRDGLESFNDLDTAQKLRFALEAKKLAFELGESAEQSGDAAAWRQRQRRSNELAYRFGALRQRMHPQDIVVSPPPRLRQLK